MSVLERIYKPSCFKTKSPANRAQEGSFLVIHNYFAGVSFIFFCNKTHWWVSRCWVCAIVLNPACLLFLIIQKKPSPKSSGLPRPAPAIREKRLIKLFLPSPVAPPMLHKGRVAIWGQDFPASSRFAWSREPVVTVRWWLLMWVTRIAAASHLPKLDITCWSDQWVLPRGWKQIPEIPIQRWWCFAYRWVSSRQGGGENRGEGEKEKEPAVTVFTNSQNPWEQMSRPK